MQRFDLKRFRIDRKLTQKELAELLMCKQNYISNIPYHKLASHFLPDFVLSQIINAPVTTIPTVKIAPNISISIILKLYFLL